MPNSDSQTEADRDLTFLEREDPFALFEDWFAEAEAAEPRDANAVQLATVDALGRPNVRTVLIKARGETGFVWYTNYQSTKGKELTDQPHSALVYYWKSLGRQVRLRGPVAKVSAEEGDAYFATRPKDSQLGAWASLQSEVLPSRDAFDKRYEEFRKRFSSADIPRPDHWSGFRLNPVYIEFWQERKFRLHDRLAFTKSPSGWERAQLYP